MSILNDEGAVLENLEVQCPNCGPVPIFVSEINDFITYDMELDCCLVCVTCPKCKSVFVWE